MNFRRIAIALTLIAATTVAAIAISASRAKEQSLGPTESAVFSGGCFWGQQAAFDGVDGVISSRVGYTGGNTPNPKYTQVVFGKTGHTEAVELTFDPTTVSFSELLQIHIDRLKPKEEAPSFGYDTHHSRAAVFVQNEKQRETVLSVVEKENAENKHILIEEPSIFWEAEAEHQNYLANCVY